MNRSDPKSDFVWVASGRDYFPKTKTVLSSVVVISTSSALVKILMKPGVSSPAKMS